MGSQNGHTTTVDVLLRQGADPNIANNVRKFNPYHTVNKLVAIMLQCNKFTSCTLSYPLCLGVRVGVCGLHKTFNVGFEHALNLWWMLILKVEGSLYFLLT